MSVNCTGDMKQIKWKRAHTAHTSPTRLQSDRPSGLRLCVRQRSSSSSSSIQSESYDSALFMTLRSAFALTACNVLPKHRLAHSDHSKSDDRLHLFTILHRPLTKHIGTWQPKKVPDVCVKSKSCAREIAEFDKPRMLLDHMFVAGGSRNEMRKKLTKARVRRKFAHVHTLIRWILEVNTDRKVEKLNELHHSS